MLQASLWPCAGLAQVRPCLFCTGEPRNGHRAPEVASLVLSREERPPPLSCWRHFLMQPRIRLTAFAVRLHCWLTVRKVHQDPQVLLCRAVFQPVGPQHVLIPRIIPSQVQEFAFSLVELEIPLGPFFSMLNGSTAIWFISHSSQFFLLSANLLMKLYPVIQVVSEGFEQYWPQYQPLGYNASVLPPSGLGAADHKPQGPDVHPLFNHCLLT